MAYDYHKIIKACIESLVDNPDALLIRQIETDQEATNSKDLHFLVACPNKMLGKLIGRHGSVADAVRTIVNVRARDERKRVHIKFEALEETADKANN